MAITTVKFLGDTIVDNIHGQDHMLSYAELVEEDSRYLVSGTSSSRIPIAPNRTWSNINIINISSTRILVSYYDNTSASMKLAIFDETGSSVATVVTVPDAIDEKAALVKLSNNFFMIAFSTSLNQGDVRTFTTSSDTITFVQDDTFSLYEVSDLALTKIDDGKIILGYKDVTNGLAYLQVITYSLSTIQVNLTSATTFNATDAATYISLVALSTTRGICYFNDSGNLEGRNILFDVDDLDITIGVEYVFDSVVGYLYDTKFISATKIAFAYIGESDYVYFGVTSIAEDVINNSNVKVIYENSSDYIDLSKIGDSDNYVVTYNTGSVLNSQIISVDLDYNIILEDLIEVSSNDVEYISSSFLDDSNLVIFYNDSGNTNYGSLNLLSNIESSTTIVDREATWVTGRTSFLANFEQSLNSGNVDYDISSFKLKRKADDGNFYITLGTFSGETTAYLDTKTRNQIAYHYILYSLDSNGNEDLGTEVDGILDFYGWFLTDGTNIYKFDLGRNSVATNQISTNKDITVYNNYTKYPSIGVGLRNYRTSSITTIPYSYNSTTSAYEFTVDTLDELQVFIDNGETKWLKNTKGEIFKCITSDFSYNYLDEIPDQPYEISFNWTEIGIGEEGLS